MLQALVEGGVWSLFQIPAMESLSRVAGGKAIDLFKECFVFSSEELQGALRESAQASLATIASGVRAEKHRSLFQDLIPKAKAKVAKEFEETLQANYIKPFAAKHKLAGPSLGAFYDQAREACILFAEDVDLWFPQDEIEPPNWSRLLQTTKAPQLTFLLVQEIQRIHPDSERVLQFLAFNELLGDALLHFFQEELRRNERVRTTLDRLQMEGLWYDLREIADLPQFLEEMFEKQKHELSQKIVEVQQSQESHQKKIEAALQEQDFGVVSELAAEAGRLKTSKATFESQKEHLPEHQHNLRNVWETTYTSLQRFDRRLTGWCDVVSVHVKDILVGIKSVHDEILKTRAAVETGFQENIHRLDGIEGSIQRLEMRLQDNNRVWVQLFQMMHNYNLSSQIEAKNEFITLEPNSIKIINKANDSLAQLEEHEELSKLAAIAVGSALSSLGEESLERSVQLLEEASQASNTEVEALAQFDLFHLHLRQRKFEAAKKSLVKAANLHPDRYALHDIGRYPIEKILGAGGMGCAFLCRNHLHGQVVIKTFWNAEKGPIEDVFSEALKMKQLGTDYFPKPLDFGYTLPTKNQRPFFVMEYVEGAIDGEEWLEQHGVLSLGEALQVALDLARAIHVAHAEGICHFDIKPANLLLRRKPGSSELQLKVIDFGLARAGHNLRDEAINKQTLTQKSQMARDIFGTRHYASPEQRGELPGVEPSFASDIYSYGLTLYCLLTGKTPSRLNSKELPEGVLGDIIWSCSNDDPRGRPESMEAILSQLEGSSDEYRVASIQDFRHFLHELETDAQSFDPQSEEVQHGGAELYGYTFQQLTEQCMVKNRIVLLEGRRGTGKTFLMRRLIAAIQSKTDPTWIGVQHSFDEEFLSRLPESHLEAVMALLLWRATRDAIHEEHGALKKSFTDLDEGLVNGLLSVLRDHPKASRKEITQSLFEQFIWDDDDRAEKQRIMAFLRHVLTGEQTWMNLVSMLRVHKIRQIHYFIDEFIESCPDPESHSSFFRILKKLRKKVQKEHFSISIISSIYPSVTEMSHFIPTHDGDLIALAFRDNYIEWHKKVTDHLLAQQLNIFLHSQHKNGLSREEYITLRNRVFEGKAIKRLSYLSSRNPREYLDMLRRCQSLTEREQRITLHVVDQVAAQSRQRKLDDLRRYASRFPQLQTTGDDAVQVFWELRELWEQLNLQRLQSGEPKTLTLRWKANDLQTIVGPLNALVFAGLVHRTIQTDTVELSLDLLFALPDIISDGDVERLDGVIDVSLHDVQRLSPSLAFLLVRQIHQEPESVTFVEGPPTSEIEDFPGTQQEIEEPQPVPVSSEDTSSVESSNPQKAPPKAVKKKRSKKKKAKRVMASPEPIEATTWNLEELLALRVTDSRLGIAKSLLKSKEMRSKKLGQLVYYSRRNERFQVHSSTVDGHNPGKELSKALVASVELFLRNDGIKLEMEEPVAQEELLALPVDVLELTDSITTKLMRNGFSTIRSLLQYREKGDKYYYHPNKTEKCNFNRRSQSRLSRTIKVFLQQNDID